MRTFVAGSTKIDALLVTGGIGDRLCRPAGVAWTAIGGFGAALGRLVGGLLATVSWRWTFMINVPIGLIAILIGWRMLPRVPGHDVPRPNPWRARPSRSPSGSRT